VLKRMFNLKDVLGIGGRGGRKMNGEKIGHLIIGPSYN